MNDILNRWPKWSIVAAAIAGGIFFLLVLDPPNTLCSSQKEIFLKKNGKMLLITAEGKKRSGKLAMSKLDRSKALCEQYRNRGACQDYFEHWKFLLEESHLLFTLQCRPEAYSIKEFREGLIGAAKLMVHLAWGQDLPPVSVDKKLGWLNISEANLFCRIKQRLRRYQKTQWDALVRSFFIDLPRSDEMLEKGERKKVWSLMLASRSCQTVN